MKDLPDNYHVSGTPARSSYCQTRDNKSTRFFITNIPPEYLPLYRILFKRIHSVFSYFQQKCITYVAGKLINRKCKLPLLQRQN